MEHLSVYISTYQVRWEEVVNFILCYLSPPTDNHYPSLSLLLVGWLYIRNEMVWRRGTGFFYFMGVIITRHLQQSPDCVLFVPSTHLYLLELEQMDVIVGGRRHSSICLPAYL